MAARARLAHSRAGQGTRDIDARPIAASEAATRIVAAVPRQPPLRIPLEEAHGCVLAETLRSPVDVPPHDNSAMDGYAVRGGDITGATADAPVALEVVAYVPAGSAPTAPVAPGQAVRIFTGAPVPEGADSVVRQEDTDGGDGIVRVFADRDAGRNIRRAGEDIPRESVVLQAGEPLGAAALGVLASIAAATPLVYRRPRVAILGSGDEIVDLDRAADVLAGRKIASSNSYTLSALIRLAGGVPVHLGIAADTPASMEEHLSGAAECDLLVTTAGISVGDHDHLRDAVASVGGELAFWRLRMRPGAPVGFGTVHGRPWIGLPGNPVSAMVTFELFVLPAIRAMMGFARPFRRSVPVRVREAVSVSTGLQHFLRAIVTDGADGPDARLTGPQGSGILTSMIRANALLIVPEGRQDVVEGERLSALRLDDPVFLATPGF